MFKVSKKPTAMTFIPKCKESEANVTSKRKESKQMHEDAFINFYSWKILECLFDKILPHQTRKKINDQQC